MTIVCRFQVLDRDEAEFPFEKWTRFRGLEFERSQLCEPAVMRKLYLSSFQAHQKELEDTTRTLGAKCHSFLTEKPVIDSITHFLRP